MAHGYTSRDGWFVDPAGRHTLLRGVNLGGSTKVPHAPDGGTHLGVDFTGWRDVSFVGRPFPLEEADEHLDRITHWGFNALRFLVTWEAIEHAGPGEYDEAYLDYVREVIRHAGERGLLVFVDPHHDVWSRWTGGDGAPYWCFELAGLRAERFVDAQAVDLHAFDWPRNYERVPVATMWTLFLGGDTFCPRLRGVQRQLQDHYIGAVCALAERLRDLDNVLGYDTFNEPSPGYIGRGKDLEHGMVLWGPLDPDPFSPLEFLAAADGLTIMKPDGRALNPEGARIWTTSCPWREARVWDLDRTGRPVLVGAEHFTKVDGEPVNPWSGYMVPFIHRFRDAVREVHPDSFVFIEGSPMEYDTPWDGDDPLVCNARHWYDISILLRRTFSPDAYESIGAGTLSGVEAIAEQYREQFEGMRWVNRERMGNPPMLIGEFGLPFDLNAGEHLRSGDYSAPAVALNAMYRALEATLLNSTHWNYTADNTHRHGDNWNREDFSIFSRDDQTDPSDPDSGGRAVSAFCRPYVRHAAGRPVRMSFDPGTGVFELELEGDPALEGPTVVCVPRLHYPKGVEAEASSGTVSHDPAAQLLRWEHDSGRVSIEIRPEGATGESVEPQDR